MDTIKGIDVSYTELNVSSYDPSSQRLSSFTLFANRFTPVQMNMTTIMDIVRFDSKYFYFMLFVERIYIYKSNYLSIYKIIYLIYAIQTLLKCNCCL